MPETAPAMAAALATSASISRPATGRTWMVTSRADSACQSLAAPDNSMTAPMVIEARKVMMAMTAIKAMARDRRLRHDRASKRGSGSSAPIPARSSRIGSLCSDAGINHRHAADLRAAPAGGHHTGPSARYRAWRCSTEVPDLLSSMNNRSRRCARLGSTLPVGSSASRSCGRAITARAIAARCFSPPDRTGGSAHMRSPRPTQCNSSTTSSRKLASCCP